MPATPLGCANSARYSISAFSIASVYLYPISDGQFKDKINHATAINSNLAQLRQQTYLRYSPSVALFTDRRMALAMSCAQKLKVAPEDSAALSDEQIVLTAKDEDLPEISQKFLDFIDSTIGQQPLTKKRKKAIAKAEKAIRNARETENSLERARIASTYMKEKYNYQTSNRDIELFWQMMIPNKFGKKRPLVVSLLNTINDLNCAEDLKMRAFRSLLKFTAYNVFSDNPQLEDLSEFAVEHVQDNKIDVTETVRSLRGRKSLQLINSSGIFVAYALMKHLEKANDKNLKSSNACEKHSRPEPTIGEIISAEKSYRPAITIKKRRLATENQLCLT